MKTRQIALEEASYKKTCDGVTNLRDEQSSFKQRH